MEKFIKITTFKCFLILIINLNVSSSLVQDHSAAFKSKTTWEVLRALMVFQVCGINVVVDNNEKVRVEIFV